MAKTLWTTAASVEILEIFAERSSDFRGHLLERRRKTQEEAIYDAKSDDIFNVNPITAEQAQQIREVLHETGASESALLTKLGVTSIEDIRGSVGFKRALSILEKDRREKKGRPA